MKKILNAMKITCTAAFIFSSVSAQSLSKSGPEPALAIASASIGEKPGTAVGHETDEAKNKVIREISKNFPNATDLQFTTTEYGSYTRFIQDGIVNRVFFNNKGKQVFAVKYYDENKLPAEIRALVKSTYYDYVILTVEEIKIADKTVFMVDIDGNKSRKTIRISDGEMETVNDFQNL